MYDIIIIRGFYFIIKEPYIYVTLKLISGDHSIHINNYEVQKTNGNSFKIIIR